MSGTLWRIEAPHFVAGLVVEAGVVTEAAPILGWTKGRRWEDVKVRLKGYGYHGAPR